MCAVGPSCYAGKNNSRVRRKTDAISKGPEEKYTRIVRDRRDIYCA